MKRLLVTDSTADIPEHVARELGIMVFPVQVILNGKSYKDRKEIKIDDFYERFEEYSSMDTEAVSYEDYALAYLQITRRYQEIIIIHCSSHLSKTCENAMRAHEDFRSKHNCRVKIIDSRQCGMGLGLMVIEAAKALRRGERFDRVVRLIRDLSARMSTYMAIPTLKYLRKTNRASGMKALFASAMGIKPVLGFEDGKIVVKSKLMGKQQDILLSLVHTLVEEIGSAPVTMAIAHGREKAHVPNLESTFRSTFNCKTIYTTYFGPSVGINTGPSTMGVAYFKHL